MTCIFPHPFYGTISIVFEAFNLMCNIFFIKTDIKEGLLWVSSRAKNYAGLFWGAQTYQISSNFQEKPLVLCVCVWVCGGVGEDIGLGVRMRVGENLVRFFF